MNLRAFAILSLNFKLSRFDSTEYLNFYSIRFKISPIFNAHFSPSMAAEIIPPA